MTLKKIAEECGVSISTVSRVLNSDIENAASKTVSDKIKKVAKEIGYTSNKETVTMRLGISKAPQTIYCLIACTTNEVNGDPFFTKAMSAVEKEGIFQNSRLDYTFYAGNPYGSDIDRLIENGKNGLLLIIGRFEHNLYNRLSEAFDNIIYLAWNDLELPCDCVLCDGIDAGRQAADYLYGLGHRKMAYIGLGSNESRFKGFSARLDELDVPLEEKNIAFTTILSFDEGKTGLLKLYNSDFNATAIYCANDTIAIGALAECKAKSINVPDDISILGTNDTEIAQYATPMISSIQIPLEEMGKMATKMLIDRANGGHTLPIKMIFSSKIIERESCKAHNKK